MRVCSVCSHPSRALIETALLDGEPLRPLAAHFGVSKDSIARHGKRHVSTTTLAAHAARLLDDLASRQPPDRRRLATLRRAILELAARATPKLPDPGGPEIRLPGHWTPEMLREVAAGAFPDDGEPELPETSVVVCEAL